MEIGRAYLNTLSHNGNDSIKVTFANTMFLHGGGGESEFVYLLDF